MTLPTMIDEVERMSGLRLCLKPLDPEVRSQTLLGEVPPPNRLHFSPFCQQVKVNFNHRCTQCDMGDVTR
ncbi:MAG: hypothetical protein ACQKBW_08550, partial [Puniceicoccales bacterium]